jgi:chromosome segregation ATPase
MVEEKDKEIEMLAKRNYELEKENETLRMELEESNLEIQKLGEKASKLASTLQASDMKINSLTAELGEKNEELQKLNKKIAVLEKELANLNELNKKLSSEVAAKDEEIKKAVEEKNKISSANLANLAKLRELEKNIKLLTDQLQKEKENRSASEEMLAMEKERVSATEKKNKIYGIAVGVLSVLVVAGGIFIYKLTSEKNSYIKRINSYESQLAKIKKEKSISDEKLRKIEEIKEMDEVMKDLSIQMAGTGGKKEEICMECYEGFYQADRETDIDTIYEKKKKYLEIALLTKDGKINEALNLLKKLKGEK